MLLKFIPDITKWNIAKVENADYMFYDCKSLSNMDDILKWNISEIKNKENIFN